MLNSLSQEEKLAMTWGRNKGYGAANRPDVGNVPGYTSKGVPPTYLEDGPQGVADKLLNVTNWPSQLTVAMTWDAELMYAWGKAMGREQYLKGTNVMLGPDLNMARVPWGGRVFEMMGEDPHHAAAMAALYVRGVQETNNISACAKHYIFNSHECNRQTYSANVPERAAHEIYLPSFLAAVDAGVGSVMCAFNRVNGSYSCENDGTLNGYLKGRLGGFDGWVMTDWGAQFTTVGGANGGLDQEMQWSQDGIIFGNNSLANAIKTGTVQSSTLDKMVLNMLTPMIALGLADDPPPNPNPFSATTPRNTHYEHAQSAAHDALAMQLAEKSIVLLKNEDDSQGNPAPLPLLNPSTSIETLNVAVYGDNITVHGTGSGGVAMPDGLPIAPVDALAKLLPGATIQYETDPATASQYQAAVVVVGMSSGEGQDRRNLSLPTAHDALVTAVAAANPSTAVVVRSPGACLMPWLDKVPSVIFQLFGGQAAGEAIAKALVGNSNIGVAVDKADVTAAGDAPGMPGTAAAGPLGINPGGKISVSFPTSEGATWLGLSVDDHDHAPTGTAVARAASPAPPGPGGNCPASVKGVNPSQYPGTVRKGNSYADAEYSEGVLVGYRWYEQQHLQQHENAANPLFCFGHGLSYTTFSYTALHVTTGTTDCNGGFSNATVEVNITNTGTAEGAEVSLLYRRLHFVGHILCCVLSPRLMRVVATSYACCRHILCVLSPHLMRVVATSYACCRHILCVLSPRLMRVVATSYACCRHILCVLSPRLMRVVATSYACCHRSCSSISARITQGPSRKLTVRSNCRASRRWVTLST
jgi:beta-glucosidase